MKWVSIKYLHRSPVIRKEGDRIGEVSVMFGSHAVSIIPSPIASGYVVTCDVLHISEQCYLFNEWKKCKSQKIRVSQVFSTNKPTGCSEIFFPFSEIVLSQGRYLTAELISDEKIQHQNLRAE